MTFTSCLMFLCVCVCMYVCTYAHMYLQLKTDKMDETAYPGVDQENKIPTAKVWTHTNKGLDTFKIQMSNC